jgi:hypothetical protein
MNAKHRRDFWPFPIFLSVALLLLIGFATVVSKRPALGNLEVLPPQNRPASLAARHTRPRVSHSVPDQNLLFDPVLVYSTYLGGPSSANYPFDMLQVATVILTDASGSLYVSGSTNSRSFPVTISVVEPNNPQKNLLGFLAKLDPTGQSLIFSTYIDGISPVSAMAMDANGNIYLAGPATPPNNAGYPVLPIPQGSTPFQAMPRAIGILKLNNSATTVLAATYLGGSGDDTVTGLAVEPGSATSNLYVTGSTVSNDFPTQGPIQSSLGSSGFNAFITSLNPTLSSAVYSTYLGQNGSASSGTGPHAIAVDTAGDSYVVGVANSGFPTTSGAIQAACPDECAFLSKLNPAGSALLYSTYIGSGSARSNAVAVDASQNVYIEGSAILSSGITAINPVPGFFPCATPNVGSGFVSEISASGSLAFSTCVIGSTSTIALDGSGNISITGTAGTGFPLKNPIQSNAPDTGAPYVATINPNTSTLVFSSFLGDGQGDSPSINDITIDSSGDLYAAGYGNDFPVFNALQSLPAGGDPPCPVMNPCVNGTNVDILKIAPTNAAAAALSTASLTFPAQAVGTPSALQTVAVVDLGSASLTVSNATATGDFSVQDGCTSAVVAAGGTCALQVAFTPTASGTRTGTLTITDSSAGSPRTVQLTGIGGQAAATLSPNPLSLSEAINTTTTSPVTLSNTGTLPLQISTIQISGATFYETNNCRVSVGAGQSCQINITFSPTAVGNSNGILTVTDSAAGGLQTVALSGADVADSIGLVYPPSSGLSSSTTPAGSVAITTIQVGGAGVSGTVNFSCSGLPQGASCSFSPSTIQMKPTVPSQVQLTISTTARSLLFVPIGLITGLLTLTILAGLILFKNVSTLSTPRLRWRLVPLFGLALCACGGGSGGSPSGGSSSSTGTPSGSYVVVITATSGSATQTLNFALTMQ